MVFLLLGVKNAWRNIGRSSIAILSMALATAFLTYSVSLGRGYSPGIYADYRGVIGGEIAAYATVFDIGADNGPETLEYRRLIESPMTDLAMFHPECFDPGYLSPVDHSEQFAPELLEEIGSYPGITAAYPRYQMPALWQGNLQGVLLDVGLRGRDPALDAMLVKHPEELICAGRWFSEEDEGQPVCVLPKHRAWSTGLLEPPAIGEKITISLPTITEMDGDYLFDRLNRQSVELTVIGYIEVSSRFLSWHATQGELIEYLYWTFEEIQLPLTTWQHLWETSGGTSFRPQQFSLIVDDVAYLEDTLFNLRSNYQGISLVSVVDQVERIKQTMEWETRPKLAPDWLYYQAPERNTRGSFQEDLRLPIGLALFMVAALVIAANLLIMVSERKTEIAVLKAVGTRRVQIMLMIVSEAFLIAVLGSVLGFLSVRTFTALSQLGGGSQLISFLLGVLRDFVLALAAAGAVSILFALLPALMMARLSVMGVMRHD